MSNTPIKTADYTDVLATEICNTMKSGGNLTTICDKYNITPYIIHKWIIKNKGFAEAYRSAQSLYCQRKIEQFGIIGDEVSKCSKRDELTRVKSAETQMTCYVKMLNYLFPERYKEKGSELFINLPEYGAATSPRERLSILAQAVCNKRISVDAAEKLARMCEIELKISDFAAFNEEIASRIGRIENILAKTSGKLSNDNQALKAAQY